MRKTAHFVSKNISFILILILFLLSIFFIAISSLYARASVRKILVGKVFLSPSHIPSATILMEKISSPSATPTASPSPTLVPTPVYTGFCLNVPVLMYHHIAPQDEANAKGFSSLNVDSSMFDQQMGYLASHGYTTIFAEDLVNALLTHTSLPVKSVVVTIDDGYEDNYSYAFPIIKKYGIKTSLFVTTFI